MTVHFIGFWAVLLLAHLSLVISLNRAQVSRATLYTEQVVVCAAVQWIVAGVAVHVPLAAAFLWLVLSVSYYGNLLHSRFFLHPADWRQIRRFLVSSEMRRMNRGILGKGAARLIRAADAVLIGWSALAMVLLLVAVPLLGSVTAYWIILDVLLLLIVALVVYRAGRIREGALEPLRFGLGFLYIAQSRNNRLRDGEDGTDNASSAETGGGDGPKLSKPPISQDQHERGKETGQAASSYFGELKNRNVIMIQLESFQHLVLGRTAEGQELTPFLNRLAKEHLVFGDVFTQYGMGHTADAEFAVLQSLLPLQHDVINFKYFTNPYYGLAHLLKERGYTTAAYHGFKSDYYNRNQMMRAHGFDAFYGEEDYFVQEKLLLGLSDQSFFAQTVSKLKSLKQPFFSFLITLTSHFPYELPKKHQHLALGEKLPKEVRDYFQIVHYTDRALHSFVNRLGEEGLLDSAVLVVYGDHEGLNPERLKTYSSFLDTEAVSFKGVYRQVEQGRKVPLLIADLSNAEQGDERMLQGRIDIPGSLLDVAPTLLYLMGLQAPEHFLGTPLLGRQGGIVPLGAYPRGSFATESLLYQASPTGWFHKGFMFDRKTGLELPLTEPEREWQALYDQSKKLFDYSRQMVESRYAPKAGKDKSKQALPTITLAKVWESAWAAIPEEAIPLPFTLRLEQGYLEAHHNDRLALESLRAIYSEQLGRNILFYHLLDGENEKRVVYFYDHNLIPHLLEKGFLVTPWQGKTLRDYLLGLPDHCLIVMAGQDDSSQAFDSAARDEYARLGIKRLDRERHLRHSYLNVTYKHGSFLNLYEQTSESVIRLVMEPGQTVTGIMIPVSLSVISAGFAAGNYSGIQVNGEALGLGSRGLNLVILDAATGEVLERTGIDTFIGLHMNETIYTAVKPLGQVRDDL